MAKNIVLKITQKGARKTGQALKGVTTSAAGLATKVGLVSAGFGALSVKLAGDFQKSLLEVSTLMKNTNSETLPNLSNELRQVAGASGLALSSLSKAKYDIVSAGFSKAAESAKILDVSTKLAVGGVTSAAAAADLLTTSLNAFGFTSAEADKVSDSLFTTVRLGKTTMEELASSMGQVLPFAKSMNLSFEDVGASMATLTASGISTAEATTALRATITALSAPSDGAKRAMDEAGISVKKFDDGTVDLISTIEQFKGVDQETIKKFIPNVRAILGVQTLANNFNVLKKNVKEFADDSAGATDLAFDKMAKGFNTTFNRLKNNIQSVMIEIGNVIIKVIQPTLEAVNTEFSKLGKIGFDILGIAVKNQLPVILDTLKKAIDLTLNDIERRLDLTAMKIVDAFNPFQDATDKIARQTKNVAEATKISNELITLLFKDMYASIVDDAEMSAMRQNEINKALEESELTRMAEELERLQAHIDSKTEITDTEDSEKENKANKAVEYISMEQFQRNQLELDMQKQLSQYKTANVSQKDIDKAYTTAFLGLKQKQREANMSYTSDVLSLSKTLASKNKEFALVEKRIAQGEAVINTYLAATKAFAKAGGYPAGILPAALTVANGLVMVGEIEKQSFADGGIVQGSDTGQGDTVPAMLTPGEVILNQAQQENLVESMGTININISGNVIGNEEFVRDTLIPEIQNGIKFA